MSTALVFSGQGSQYVGMGQGVLAESAVGRSTFEEADEALGFSLSRLVAEGPAEDLTLTENAQPAILAFSIALLRLMRERDEIGVVSDQIGAPTWATSLARTIWGLVANGSDWSTRWDARGGR